MSLPLGFSPFDDYDSPYASTNAAIRRQSRNLQGQGTPGQMTPTSSFQQQQGQRRPSQVSFGGVSQASDIPPRRSSPPPPIPAAEDFGSNKRFSSSRAPSMDSQGFRQIAKPTPLGAPWGNEGSPSSSSLRNTPAQPGRSPPISPRPTPLNSSLAPSDNRSASSPTRRAPPPIPSTRNNSSSPKGATEPADYPSPQSQRQGAPPPVPMMASLPEPAEPPAASDVALATPADGDASAAAGPSHSAAPNAHAQEMQEMRSVHSHGGNDTMEDESEQMISAVTSDDEGEQQMSGFRTPTEEEAPMSEDTDAYESSRRDGHKGAGAAAGVAGLGAAAALSSGSSSSNVSPRRVRDDPHAAPHSSYNMDSATGFNEKQRSDERAPLAAAAGGAGAASASRSYKPLNEGSRGGWSDSAGAGAGGAAGGAGAGSALARSWRSHKKRWIIGIVVLLVIIIAAAVGGGVAGSSGSSGSSNSSGSGTGTGSGTGSGSNTPNGNTPTATGVGPLDSRLSRSFYGINYAPVGSSLTEGCESNITGVIHDITILSQLTSRVRLLGSACNQTALVLDAIGRLGVDMQVWPGVILTSSMTLTSTTFTDQLDNISFAFDNYGTSNVGGLYVGDEYVTSLGSQASLLQFLTATRELIDDNSAWGTVLVGSTETISTWSASLAENVDFVFANDESWDEGYIGAEGAAYSYSNFEDNAVEAAADADNNPPAYLASIGWPTATGAGVSNTLNSVANLQSLLDAWVCDANTNGTGYFWFELYDDSLTAIEASGSTSSDTGLAGYWGLFDSSRNLKDITLPDCPL